jgi:DNA-binding NtrC family response regulator
MVTRYVTTEVEVELSDFDTDDLIEELELRCCDYNTKGVDGDEMREVLEQIWMKRRTNKDYQSELDQLIYGVLGKIV